VSLLFLVSFSALIEGACAMTRRGIEVGSPLRVDVAGKARGAPVGELVPEVECSTDVRVSALATTNAATSRSRGRPDR
jgi:hypothetical protein